MFLRNECAAFVLFAAQGNVLTGVFGVHLGNSAVPLGPTSLRSWQRSAADTSTFLFQKNFFYDSSTLYLLSFVEANLVLRESSLNYHWAGSVIAMIDSVIVVALSLSFIRAIDSDACLYAVPSQCTSRIFSDFKWAVPLFRLTPRPFRS